MAEGDFLKVLSRLKLDYESCGSRDGSIALPVPRQPPRADLSAAYFCYEIIGGLDPKRHIGERYRAYVDKEHRVFYIENAYSYAGP
jgi:hypothetical protein